jgi:hypothetical protein
MTKFFGRQSRWKYSIGNNGANNQNGSKRGASKRGQQIGDECIIGSDNRDGSNGANKSKQWGQQSEWKQLVKMEPAIGGSNQVAGCDRWVTN